MAAVVAALGPADRSPDLRRWTWLDGDAGVFIDNLTHVWQAVVWTPQRSVTLRGLDHPTHADMTTVIALAGLCELGRAHVGLGLDCTPCAGPCRIDDDR